MTTPRDFIRANGSIDINAAMGAGRRARAQAAQAGIAEVKRVFVSEPRVRRRLFW